MDGDWIEVPSYSADGDVLNISLHSFKFQNCDKTISVVPTYKLVEVPFRNWRGMQESGGRRIKRAIYLDLTSVRFCDAAIIERLSKIGIIKEYVADQQSQFEGGETTDSTDLENPVNAHHFINLDAFRACVNEYLKSRQDLHHKDMTLLVR